MKKLAQITNVYSNNEVYLFDEDQKDFSAYIKKINGKAPTKDKLEKLDKMIEYIIVEPLLAPTPFIEVVITDIPALEL